MFILLAIMIGARFGLLCDSSFEFPFDSYALTSFIEIKTQLVGTEGIIWLAKQQRGYLIAGFGNTNNVADVFYVKANPNHHELEFQSCELKHEELVNCVEEGDWEILACKINKYTYNWSIQVKRNMNKVVNIPISPTWNNFYTESAEEHERPEDFNTNPEVVFASSFLNFEFTGILRVFHSLLFLIYFVEFFLF